MESSATDEQQPDRGTYQVLKDTVRPPNLTINSLPDEVLLEIIDSFRQSVDPYDQQWKKEHLWLNLAHVCRKWRAVMFASITRLDLGITVGPEKPGHIKTILSGPLPIFLDYRNYDSEDLTGSALWRMRAALKHHPDRVREITFEGEWASFNKFFKMTKCTFPMLESLSLYFLCHEPDIPATFLRGPDLSYLHLQRLTVECVPFSSISGFLSSATALTDLTLVIDYPFGTSQETSLPGCLRGMPCLRSLDLTLLSIYLGTPSRPSTEDTVILWLPEEIVILPKLTRFHYTGDYTLLKSFLPCLRAPSLKDIRIRRDDAYLASINMPPYPYFDNDIEEHSNAA